MTTPLPNPDAIKDVPPEALRNFLSIYHALALDLTNLDAAYARAMQSLCLQWTNQLAPLIERVEAGQGDIERAVVADLIKLDGKFALGIESVAREWTTKLNARLERFHAECAAIIDTAGETPPAVN